jgi:hypothetical protein
LNRGRKRKGKDIWLRATSNAHVLSSSFPLAAVRALAPAKAATAMGWAGAEKCRRNVLCSLSAKKKWKKK